MRVETNPGAGTGIDADDEKPAVLLSLEMT
jgi:hypothetical protein